MRVKAQTSTHIWVPDTQVDPGTPTIHLDWIGQFIADEYGDCEPTVIQGGDWHNMGSLSSYDRKGGTKMEGRRYRLDVDYGNDAWDRWNEPWKNVPARRIFLLGNHEYRIVRAQEADAQLEGAVSLDHLAQFQWDGWETYDFLEPVTVDGVMYSHYFANPMTGRPYGGRNVETRLKTIGHSFTMGHQQGLMWGRVETLQGPHLGLVAGSCYLHDEDYLGYQGNSQWRGIVVCHDVVDGEYDPMPVSLKYLCRRYEGQELAVLKEKL